MDDDMQMPSLMITGGDIVLPGGDVLEQGTLVIHEGKIHGVLDEVPQASQLDHDMPMIDARGCWVTPGLVDQHMHGAFGTDFNTSDTRTIHELLTTLPKHGITAVLPTLMTAPKLDLMTALSTMEEAIYTLEPYETRLLGIHLEGPFLSPAHKGAHPEESLLAATAENLEGLLSPNVKRVTLAPELDPSCAFLKQLIEDGYLCSLGHTGADYELALRAMELGAQCITHLFNAMAGLHHRDSSIALAALVQDEVFVEIIGDGHHVSSEMMQLLFKTKPLDKVILISDCNMLTGMEPGATVKFGQHTVTLHEEGPRNEEGRLAGSSTLISDCVRHMVHTGVVSFPEAIQLATYNPAMYLGVDGLLGHLSPNTLADVVLWNQQTLQIRTTFLGGIAMTEGNNALPTS